MQGKIVKFTVKVTQRVPDLEGHLKKVGYMLGTRAPSKNLMITIPLGKEPNLNPYAKAQQKTKIDTFPLKNIE